MRPGNAAWACPPSRPCALEGTLATDQQPRAPFDADADGYVPGEGVGVLVLKRLADAIRDGDRIRAVIRGIGAAPTIRSKHVSRPSSVTEDGRDPARGNRHLGDRWLGPAATDPGSLEGRAKVGGTRAAAVGRLADRADRPHKVPRRWLRSAESAY